MKGTCRNVKILALLKLLLYCSNEGKSFLCRLTFFGWILKVSVLYGLFEYELYVRDGRAAPLVVLLHAARAHELVRVGAVGKDENLGLEIFRKKNLYSALRRVYPGAVTIIVDDNFARKPPK